MSACGTETDMVHRQPNPFRGRRSLAVEAAEEFQIRAPGQIRIEPGRVHEAGDTVRQPPVDRVDAPSRNAHRARVAVDQAEHHAHQRGLARAIRPEQSV